MTSSAPVARIASIDSWPIDVPDQAWLIDRIVQDVGEGRGGTVFTINLDHLAKLRRDDAFRGAYGRATHVSADGVPVVLLAHAGGVAIERVTGADLVVPLCRAAATAGISVHFFGTRAEILERAVARLRAEVPGLVVAGTEAPALGFEPHSDEARRAVERIAASGAGICFVALGAPRQELFADAAQAWSQGVVYLAVGAALDFLAGERVRAPRIFQRLGLEWLWRTAQEPRRMLPRYARSAGWLVGYLLRLAVGVAHLSAVEVTVDRRRSSSADRGAASPVKAREVSR
jgi:exopolysaccharide biosynthesis WecB/TagA/CpsF family protein